MHIVAPVQLNYIIFRSVTFVFDHIANIGNMIANQTVEIYTHTYPRIYPQFNNNVLTNRPRTYNMIV